MFAFSSSFCPFGVLLLLLLLQSVSEDHISRDWGHAESGSTSSSRDRENKWWVISHFSVLG